MRTPNLRTPSIRSNPRLFAALLTLCFACTSETVDDSSSWRLSATDCEPPSKPNKERVCHHSNGDGHILIEVSANAASHHLDPQQGHAGDVVPGEAGLNCVCEPLTDANLCAGASSGTACSDDDACTVGDACDG